MSCDRKSEDRVQDRRVWRVPLMVATQSLLHDLGDPYRLCPKLECGLHARADRRPKMPSPAGRGEILDPTMAGSPVYMRWRRLDRFDRHREDPPPGAAEDAGLRRFCDDRGDDRTGPRMKRLLCPCGTLKVRVAPMAHHAFLPLDLPMRRWKSDHGGDADPDHDDDRPGAGGPGLDHRARMLLEDGRDLAREALRLGPGRGGGWRVGKRPMKWKRLDWKMLHARPGRPLDADAVKPGAHLRDHGGRKAWDRDAVDVPAQKVDVHRVLKGTRDGEPLRTESELRVVPVDQLKMGNLVVPDSGPKLHGPELCMSHDADAPFGHKFWVTGARDGPGGTGTGGSKDLIPNLPLGHPYGQPLGPINRFTSSHYDEFHTRTWCRSLSLKRCRYPLLPNSCP